MLTLLLSMRQDSWQTGQHQQAAELVNIAETQAGSWAHITGSELEAVQLSAVSCVQQQQQRLFKGWS
jgi:hypothetical protein